MVSPLIGLHAAFGEIGIVAFIWVFVELLNPTPKTIKRAKIAALLGVILFFLSWIVGGYYYLYTYSANVKPLIKVGPQPWAHEIFTEIKEHVFLFLPFISLFTYSLLRKHEKNLPTDKKARRAILYLCVLIVIIGALMGLMGYLISTGARTALEVKP